jgi:penicillin-binding protein 2
MSGLSQMRLHILALVCLAALLLLAGKLWMLQLTQWVDWAKAAAGNRISITYAAAPRGLIFDRKGAALAGNRPVWQVSIVPAKFPEAQDEAERVVLKLAGILQVPSPELRPQVLAAAARKGMEYVPVGELGADVSFKKVAQIEEQALPGVTITQSAMRTYPRGRLVAHALGYARGIGDEQYAQVQDLKYPQPAQTTRDPAVAAIPPDPMYSRDSVFGQDGVERTYEINLDVAPPLPVLCGQRGRTVYEVDAALNPVRLIEFRPSSVGASLYLTIDATVQAAAEEGLRHALSGHGNRTGAAVVMDVEDGGLLALASLPAFNPNDWVKRIPAALWRKLNDDPRKPLFNKATSGGYPPASTFKLVSMTAALDLAKVTPNQRYYCVGRIREGPQIFGCWKPDGHKSLDLREAMAQSCDVYFYELTRQAGLGPGDLARYARIFGLGQPTGIDLPEELEGLVPSPEWKKNTYGVNWWNGDTLNMVIGQGATTVTPLQMARACAAVANGGHLVRPHLVRRIVWPEQLHLPPTVQGRVVDATLEVRPETLQIVREGMRLAVTHGTAARLREMPVSVAAKTGSAEHLRGRPTHAWFVCFVPYEKPRYAIAVFVSEGGHGGETAAPVAAKIIAALYGVKAQGIGAAVPSD